jgi:DNA-binding MarR family transcriptional regulator
VVAAEAAPGILTEPLKKILRSLAKPDLLRASPKDIAFDSGIREDEVQRLLEGLDAEGFVKPRKPAPDGSQRWRLTTLGRAFADQL